MRPEVRVETPLSKRSVWTRDFLIFKRVGIFVTHVRMRSIMHIVLPAVTYRGAFILVVAERVRDSTGSFAVRQRLISVATSLRSLLVRTKHGLNTAEIEHHCGALLNRLPRPTPRWHNSL